MRSRPLTTNVSRLLCTLFTTLFLTSATAFAGATITIVNLDGPGEGFNDPTPAAPIGGNPGTTVGQQRLIAFQFAADIWGATLDSPAEIKIQAQFDPLTCTATTGVLGSAGARVVISDFPGTEFPRTWYHIALANKRAGGDLIPGPPGSSADDITARFNSNIGQPGCLTTSGWYYGLDTNEPPGRVNLVVVLLHEFAHGLGFQSFVNVSTGQKLQNLDDIYIKYAFDTSVGKRLTEMTDAERRAAIINSRRVVWDGANVTAAVPLVLSPGTPLLFINSPAGIAGSYSVGTATFGPPLTESGVTGDVVLANDGSSETIPPGAPGGTVTDGCQPFVNAADMSGKIALVDRGACGFTVKVKNAQDAGAISVLVADNVTDSPPPILGGSDPTITIPAVRISLEDGNKIKAALASGTVNATLKLDPAVRAGADALNRAILYGPNPVRPGSSFSHWDPIATPNQLMEPFNTSDLTFSVKPPEDLTLPLMRDIGWFEDADGDGFPDGVDVSPPRFRTTSALTRDCATGEYTATVTLTNSGTSVSNNVQITMATLGEAGTLSPTPVLLGTLKPGESATRTLRFPSAAGVHGARVVLLINGTHTTTFVGGTFSTSSGKVLPSICAP